jgi:argininosuccinate lyase
VLRLLGAVLDNLRFRKDRMLEVCEREYLGGFTLANLLTLDEDVPWRRAQVIAGQYIVAASGRGLSPRETAPDLLREVALAHGFALAEPGRALAVAFDVEESLRRKRSAGSAHPDAVRELLVEQAAHLDEQRAQWEGRGGRLRGALGEIDRQLGI